MNKLYSFQYLDYGVSYHVVAESPQKALDYLKGHLKNETIGKEKHGRNVVYGNYYITAEWEEYERWENATVDNLPSGYSVVVREVGDILITEMS